MSTVMEAVELLNKQHVHPVGHHVTIVDQRFLPEKNACDETPHRLMRQTFDWRYPFVKPDKEEYTVRLSADDIRYIGNAIEVYDKILFELYVGPAFKRMVAKMGGTDEETEGAQADAGTDGRKG